MKKKPWVEVTLGVVLIVGIAGAWWFLRQPRSPPEDAFKRLHGGFIVAWQANGVSLRRSLLVRQALDRAAAEKLNPDYIERLRKADWISGVILPGGRTEMAIEGYNVPFVTITGPIPGPGPATTQVAELEPLPWGKDFWLVVDPRSTAPLTIGPINGTTVQFPSELLNSPRPIVVYGTAGLLSLELEAAAEYQSAAEAERLASSLRGFLGLMRNLMKLGRNATADQAQKLFWESLEVKNEGPRLVVRAKLDEVGLVRLLYAARPPKSGL